MVIIAMDACLKKSFNFTSGYGMTIGKNVTVLTGPSILVDGK